MLNAAEGLGEFFDYIWGDTKGLVYTPVLFEKAMAKTMFKWPEQRAAVINHVLTAAAEGKDALYCPALFEKSPPTKENILGTHVLWADFDGNPPKSFGEGAPSPSLTIQSSGPKNLHTYWKLDEFLSDVKSIEDRNRSIAYTYRADTSGWDANQLLRPPFTVNSRFGKTGNPVPVQRVSEYGDAVSARGFNLQPAKTIVNDRIKLNELPDIKNVIATFKWSDQMWKLFQEKTEDVKDRSSALQLLGYLGVENDFSDEAIYSVIEFADRRWGKYVGRHDREHRLLDIINRAREKLGYAPNDVSMVERLVNSLDQPQLKYAYNFMEFTEAYFEFDWFFKGLLIEKGFGIISGEPSVGKTQAIIQMAGALAVGRDFLVWPLEKKAKRKVLFLSLEMGHIPLQLFLKNISNDYSDTEKEDLRKNFTVIPSGKSLFFDTPEGRNLVISYVQEFAPDVIFVDSFSKVVSQPLTDEIAVKAFNSFVDNVLRDELGCAVVLVHHNRKTQNGMSRPNPELSDIYGNVNITAALDFAMILRKTHRKNHIELHHVKSRLGTEEEMFGLVRNENLTYVIDDNEGSFNAAGHSGGVIIGADSYTDTEQDGDFNFPV